jgi:hypothetical protein
MDDPIEEQKQILRLASRLGFHEEVLGHALGRLETSSVKVDFVQTGMRPLDLVVKVNVGGRPYAQNYCALTRPNARYTPTLQRLTPTWGVARTSHIR